MSIQIDKAACIGCTRCQNACPGSLIAMDADNRAYIRYPRDCWGCTACLKECQAGAIAYYLGADIGGRGSLLRVRREAGLVHWQVTLPHGGTQTITINPEDSNNY